MNSDLNATVDGIARQRRRQHGRHWSAQNGLCCLVAEFARIQPNRILANSATRITSTGAALALEILQHVTEGHQALTPHFLDVQCLEEPPA